MNHFFLFQINIKYSTTQKMIKYTQNKIYLSLYSLAEKNMYYKAVPKTSSFGISQLHTKQNFVKKKKKNT